MNLLNQFCYDSPQYCPSIAFSPDFIPSTTDMTFKSIKEQDGLFQDETVTSTDVKIRPIQRVLLQIVTHVYKS
jgi:hypothetical protein